MFCQFPFLCMVSFEKWHGLCFSEMKTTRTEKGSHTMPRRKNTDKASRPTFAQQVESERTRMTSRLASRAQCASWIAKCAKTAKGRASAYKAKTRSIVRLIEMNDVGRVAVDVSSPEGLLSIELTRRIRLHSSLRWLADAGLRENQNLYRKLGQDD